MFRKIWSIFAGSGLLAAGHFVGYTIEGLGDLFGEYLKERGMALVNVKDLAASCVDFEVRGQNGELVYVMTAKVTRESEEGVRLFLDFLREVKKAFVKIT